jgi:hypothetical protein
MLTSRRYVVLAVLGISIIAACAIIAGYYFINQADRMQRDNLLIQAKDASLLVDADDLKTLTATEADLEHPTYVRLKKDFTVFRSHNPAIRFVYILGYHADARIQFFYVDSEPEDSEDYSPPGQLFADTRQYDIDMYLRAQPYTDGPYSDTWGEWVSGYAPVLADDGSIAGLVGIDMSTSIWHDQARFVWWTVCIIAVLLSIVYLLGMRTLWRMHFSLNQLLGRTRELETREQKLSDIERLANIGRISIYLADETVRIDDRFVRMFDATTITLRSFILAVHPDDRPGVEAALSEMRGGEVTYNWFDARIGTPADGYRKYHVYGTIVGDDPQTRHFSGVMQDTTDIT